MTSQGNPYLGSPRADPALNRIEKALAALAENQRLLRDEMRVRWRQEDAAIDRLTLRAEIEIESTRRERDGVAGLRERLEAFRATPDYARAWDDDHPLVSVRIASYNKTRELIEVALESVFAQTYDNIEVIVVNDGPNERTRAALEAIGDPRVRYVELPERGSYPLDAHLRWMVAGSPGMNEGARLARGAWIAPLDDDDEFVGDHIEKLLELARAEHAEFVYGALIQRDLEERVDRIIYSYPPRISEFSFQSTLYLSGLRFFEYDVESWRVGEPGDWNLIRRMVSAGVRMASTDDIHAFMNMIRFDHRPDS